MSKIETKIKELNIKLPDPKPPVGAYVATKIVGNLLFISGQISADENLKLIIGDIRDKNKYESAVDGCDIVIHLACISNDPSYALNEKLSKTINYALRDKNFNFDKLKELKDKFNWHSFAKKIMSFINEI